MALAAAGRLSVFAAAEGDRGAGQGEGQGEEESESPSQPLRRLIRPTPFLLELLRLPRRLRLLLLELL
eukprot:10175317-Heterocapsa_arctica.AAC.1